MNTIFDSFSGCFVYLVAPGWPCAFMNWYQGSSTSWTYVKRSRALTSFRLVAPRERETGSRHQELSCLLIVWRTSCSRRTLREPRRLVVFRLRGLGAGGQMASAEGQWNLQGPQQRKPSVRSVSSDEATSGQLQHTSAASGRRGGAEASAGLCSLVPTWLFDNG